MNREALIALKEKVEAGTFPADVSARILGLSEVAERGGLPVIKEMYRSFSGSLDAAKALHDAVLPGWWWSIEPELDDGRVFALVGTASCIKSPFFGESTNPARAWLLAILSALIAQEEGSDGQG